MPHILGSRRYLEIPGTKTHVLPPLIKKRVPQKLSHGIYKTALRLIQADKLVGALDYKSKEPEIDSDGLAANLVEEYQNFLIAWSWGNSILEWIRQCRITFEHQPSLKPLVQSDLWPHANLTIFVRLLNDKRIELGGLKGLGPAEAVGAKLPFRRPPSFHYFADTFLLLPQNRFMSQAYQGWAMADSNPTLHLPRERFTFLVIDEEETRQL